MPAVDAVGGWPAVLAKLAASQDLDPAEARAAMETILGGEAPDGPLAAFAVAMRVKGETVAEINAMVEALMDHAELVDIEPGAIDIVGTGGAPSRRAAALSVSTMACFVAAAAGARVCKHGNVKASATAGSFDTIPALGINIDLAPAAVAECVQRVGLGFCFARSHHPAMRHAGPVRAQLGIPTVFNFLGPLANPARVDHMLLGVSDPKAAPLLAGVLAERGVRAWVVHGADGLDELSTTGESQVFDVADGQVTETSVSPADVGLATATLDDLVGGDGARNAEIAEAMFGGETGPRRDIVVYNAGAALAIAGVAADHESGVRAAEAALDDGRATRLLDQARAVTAELSGG